MLAPDERHLYADALRPPAGFRLGFAVGTTYSLDLSALLAVPLAFAMHEWRDGESQLLDDPLAALDAVRKCAGRVALFCQAGRIAAPARNHALYTFLEGSIFESRVAAPGKAGEFHAKTWVLRYESERHEEVRYRFVVLSRNLTLDQSWDTVLSFEGPLVKERARGYSRNVPLHDFLLALPGFARRDVPAELAAEIARMAADVRKVDFAVPEPFEEMSIHPIGIEGYRPPKITEDGTRIAVVSPFVTTGALESLGCGKEDVLVARPEEIDALGAKGIGAFRQVYTLDEGAEPEMDALAEGDRERATRRGLHAKVYVVDEGWKASVWSGSANATNAGFHANLEILVRLTGKKKDVGVDVFLDGRDGRSGFRSLLMPYTPPEEAVAPDAAALAAEERVEEIRRALSAAPLALVASAEAGGTWRLVLSLDGRLDFAGATVRCKPVTPVRELVDASALGRESIAFGGLPMHYLTSLIAFEVAAGTGEARTTARFVLNLPLAGAPAERHQAALQAMIGSPERLLRYLLLLLADDGEEIAASELAALVEGAPGAAAQGSGVAGLPLTEELVRTLARAPQRLDAVQRLVEDLKKTPEGAKLLPAGFDELWRAISTARRERSEERGAGQVRA